MSASKLLQTLLDQPLFIRKTARCSALKDDKVFNNLTKRLRTKRAAKKK